MTVPPAGAQLLPHKDLSQATALVTATAADETCKGQGYRVSVTVVGRNGEPLVQLRGEDASPQRSLTASSRTRHISRCMYPTPYLRKAPCRSRSVRRSSVRSAYPALRAAIRTRPAPNPASIRSPTSSNRVSDVSDLSPFSAVL